MNAKAVISLHLPGLSYGVSLWFSPLYKHFFIII